MDWIDLSVALGFAKLRVGAYRRAHEILVEASERAEELDATLKFWTRPSLLGRR